MNPDNPTTGEWTDKTVADLIGLGPLTDSCKRVADAHNAALAAKDEEWKRKHCKDCCCARAWEALGDSVKGVGSIPEHILQLREQLAAEQEKVEQAEASFAAMLDVEKELRKQLAAERERAARWRVELAQMTRQNDAAQRLMNVKWRENEQLREQLDVERERKETALKMFDEAFDKNVKATQGWATCQQQLAAAVEALKKVDCYGEGLIAREYDPHSFTVTKLVAHCRAALAKIGER